MDPFLLDTSAPLINVKEEKVSESIIEPAADQSPCTSDGFSSEVIEGLDITILLVCELQSLKFIIDPGLVVFPFFIFHLFVGSETTNQAQSKEICYPKTSFMHDHSREGVTCW